MMSIARGLPGREGELAAEVPPADHGSRPGLGQLAGRGWSTRTIRSRPARLVLPTLSPYLGATGADTPPDAAALEAAAGWDAGQVLVVAVALPPVGLETVIEVPVSCRADSGMAIRSPGLDGGVPVGLTAAPLLFIPAGGPFRLTVGAGLLVGGGGCPVAGTPAGCVPKGD